MLKGRRGRFVEEYVIDYNATRAAKAVGYSAKTAYSQGSRLLKDPEVAAAIKVRREQLHKERTADEYEVIEFLTEVMRGKEPTENIPIFVGKGLQEYKEGKPSARDRLNAAKLLGEHYGIFDKDNMPDEDNGGTGVIFIPEVISDG